MQFTHINRKANEANENSGEKKTSDGKLTVIKIEKRFSDFIIII